MEIIDLFGSTEDEKTHIAFLATSFRGKIKEKRHRDQGTGEPQIDSRRRCSLHRASLHHVRRASASGNKLIAPSAREGRRGALLKGKTGALVVDRAIIQEFLGGHQGPRGGTELAERTRRSGVAVGLAWTPAGGDVFVHEAKPDERQMGGRFKMTGQIGEVMAGVYAGAALTWYVPTPQRWGWMKTSTKDLDIHIPRSCWEPSPKDGPFGRVSPWQTTLVSLMSRSARFVRLTAMNR